MERSWDLVPWDRVEFPKKGPNGLLMKTQPSCSKGPQHHLEANRIQWQSRIVADMEWSWAETIRQAPCTANCRAWLMEPLVIQSMVNGFFPWSTDIWTWIFVFLWLNHDYALFFLLRIRKYICIYFILIL